MLWTDQDEIDQLQEILDLLEKGVNENTEEEVYDIIHKPSDDYGGYVLEGYKWLRGFRNYFDGKKPIEEFIEGIKESQEYARKNMARRNQPVTRLAESVNEALGTLKCTDISYWKLVNNHEKIIEEIRKLNNKVDQLITLVKINEARLKTLQEEVGCAVYDGGG